MLFLPHRIGKSCAIGVQLFRLLPVRNVPRHCPIVSRPKRLVRGTEGGEKIHDDYAVERSREKEQMSPSEKVRLGKRERVTRLFTLLHFICMHVTCRIILTLDTSFTCTRLYSLGSLVAGQC